MDSEINYSRGEYPGGKHGHRVPQRRIDAAERAEARSNRSPQQQLARLDALLGEGVGATKERARLAGQIANPPKVKPETSLMRSKAMS
jgi:hypothetical protein